MFWDTFLQQLWVFRITLWQNLISQLGGCPLPPMPCQEEPQLLPR